MLASRPLSWILLVFGASETGGADYGMYPSRSHYARAPKSCLACMTQVPSRACWPLAGLAARALRGVGECVMHVVYSSSGGSRSRKQNSRGVYGMVWQQKVGRPRERAHSTAGSLADKAGIMDGRAVVGCGRRRVRRGMFYSAQTQRSKTEEYRDTLSLLSRAPRGRQTPPATRALRGARAQRLVGREEGAREVTQVEKASFSSYWMG